MDRPRVLLDCDGVLSDFTSAAVELVNRIFGGDHRAENVRHFDFCASLGLSREQASMIKRAIGSTVGFARNLGVYPGAIEGVRRLREIADVIIVTSPWNNNATWTHDREDWLHRHFRIPHSEVIHTSAKYVCNGDFFVDDKSDAVERWATEHKFRGAALRWATPHNQLDSFQGRTVHSWDELIAVVE